MLDVESVKAKLAEFAKEAQRLGIDILPWEVANTALLVQLSECMSPENAAIIRMFTALEERLDTLDKLYEVLRPMTREEFEATKSQGIRRLQEDTHTGIMLAFWLDAETAQKLAIAGGEPAGELHVTLCFMGDKSDFASDKIEYIKATVADFASDTGPLIGSIGGIGRFTPSDSSENISPIVALVNIPGLQLLHSRLIKGFYLDAEISIIEDFDYMPHITLCYIDPDAPMPIQNIEPFPLAFDTLWLCIGDERIPFRLGEPEPQEDRAKHWTEEVYSVKVEMIDKNGDAFRRASTKMIPSAKWIIEKAQTYPGCHIALMGGTTRGVQDMAEGILACSSPDFVPEYQRSRGRLIWPNGSRAFLVNAQQSEQLRGLRYRFAWGHRISDEAQGWLRVRLRGGNEPEMLITEDESPHNQAINALNVVLDRDRKAIEAVALGEATIDSIGNPLDLSNDDLDNLSKVTDEDLKNAVKHWDDNAPEGFAGMLNAEEEK
jgi:Uncharacterized conserved protein